MPSNGLNSQIRSNISPFNKPSSLAYLFQNEEEKSLPNNSDRIPTPDITSYLRMTDPDDRFPTLSRRDDSGLVSFFSSNNILLVGLN